MTGSGAQSSQRWHGVEAVVAAYAGTSSGRDAFAHALAALRRALSGARVWLLWPEEVQLCAGAYEAEAVIAYPRPSADAARDAAARLRVLTAVDALAASGAEASVVFAERDAAPYLPAYLCYLAGIGYRAGIETEFGGAVLSPAVRLPAALDDVARHLALLDSVGLAAGACLPVPPRPAAATTVRST